MQDVLDLVRFPLDDLDGIAGRALVARCRDDLDRFGLCDLDGLVRPAALRRALAEIAPALDAAAGQPRRHSVYPDPPALPKGHPALAPVESSGRSVTGAALGDCLLARIHRYAPLAEFLARVTGTPRLNPAEDGLSVTRQDAGEAAGWRFSRAEFNVTILLQAPRFGGHFEYVRDLRSGSDPNPDGVAALLAGKVAVSLERLMPGTLNLFRGRDSAYRVTPVGGDSARIIAEFAFSGRPGRTVAASHEDRVAAALR